MGMEVGDILTYTLFIFSNMLRRTSCHCRNKDWAKAIDNKAQTDSSLCFLPFEVSGGETNL